MLLLRGMSFHQFVYFDLADHWKEADEEVFYFDLLTIIFNFIFIIIMYMLTLAILLAVSSFMLDH